MLQPAILTAITLKIVATAKKWLSKNKEGIQMVFFPLPPCNNKHACLETKIIINVYPEKLNISLENKTKNI